MIFHFHQVFGKHHLSVLCDCQIPNSLRRKEPHTSKVFSAFIFQESHPLVQPTCLPHLSSHDRTSTGNFSVFVQSCNFWNVDLDSSPYLLSNIWRVPDQSPTFALIVLLSLVTISDLDHCSLPGTAGLCGCEKSCTFGRGKDIVNDVGL